MAFNKNLPADTTYLKDGPGVIRANWAAIESADSSFIPDAINLTNRTVAGLASDPTAIADTYIIYSKTTGAATELFGIDPDSNITQLTGGGSSATANGWTTLPGGLLLQWGSQNCTSGDQITFPKAFPTAVYSINVTSGGGAAVASVKNGSATVLKFNVEGTFIAGRKIYWMAIGK